MTDLFPFLLSHRGGEVAICELLFGFPMFIGVLLFSSASYLGCVFVMSGCAYQLPLLFVGAHTRVLMCIAAHVSACVIDYFKHRACSQASSILSESLPLSLHDLPSTSSTFYLLHFRVPPCPTLLLFFLLSFPNAFFPTWPSVGVGHGRDHKQGHQ